MPFAKLVYIDGKPETKTAPDKEAAWNEALRAYAKGRFNDALPVFTSLKSVGSMAVAAAMYEERCGLLLAAPPENWDGIWTYQTK